MNHKRIRHPSPWAQIHCQRGSLTTPEVSRRVDDRIRKATFEIAALLKILGHKFQPWDYSGVTENLAIAHARLLEAQDNYVVPLFQAQGRP